MKWPEIDSIWKKDGRRWKIVRVDSTVPNILMEEVFSLPEGPPFLLPNVQWLTGEDVRKWKEILAPDISEPVIGGIPVSVILKNPKLLASALTIPLRAATMSFHNRDHCGQGQLLKEAMVNLTLIVNELTKPK